MDRNKLQVYASLAEVVSAIAIIVSLLYVAFEVRQTSTMSSRDADVMLFERGREANRLVIESPGLAELIVTAATAPNELSAADRVRFLTYQHDFFDSWEMGWFYHVDGILDDALWIEWDEWFASEALRRPIFAWEENRQNFPGTAFREHVDAILAAN